jgi:hypothetical protein
MHNLYQKKREKKGYGKVYEVATVFAEFFDGGNIVVVGAFSNDNKKCVLLTILVPCMEVLISFFNGAVSIPTVSVRSPSKRIEKAFRKGLLCTSHVKGWNSRTAFSGLAHQEN